jgi:hypothetical protein
MQKQQEDENVRCLYLLVGKDAVGKLSVQLCETAVVLDRQSLPDVFESLEPGGEYMMSSNCFVNDKVGVDAIHQLMVIFTSSGNENIAQVMMFLLKRGVDLGLTLGHKLAKDGVDLSAVFSDVTPEFTGVVVSGESRAVDADEDGDSRRGVPKKGTEN